MSPTINGVYMGPIPGPPSGEPEPPDTPKRRRMKRALHAVYVLMGLLFVLWLVVLFPHGGGGRPTMIGEGQQAPRREEP
ncbi:MAG: hypothetical protein RIB58_09130 [Phycisphaerales bacterium]